MRLAAHRARRPRSTGRTGAHSRRLTAVAVLATCMLVTAACSSSDSDAAPTATVPTAPTTDATTTTEPATTTTAAPTPEEEVEAAYLAAQTAFYEASVAADPDDPKLAETAIGPNLELSQNVLTQLKADGLQAQFVNDEPPTTDVIKVELSDPTEAVVESCIVDNTQQVRTDDGTVVNDTVASRRNRAEMRLDGTTWKLYDQVRLERWEDDKGCDR